MIKLGLRLDWLGTPLLTWRDLKVIMKHLPADSAMSREVQPQHWQWLDLKTQLMAGLLNMVAQSLHLRYGRGRFEPPVKPPGFMIDKKRGRPVTRKGSGSTITEMDEWLRKRREAGKL